MGNPLNSVLKYIDPIGNAAGNAISGPKGILTPKQAPGAPGYDPSKNPGTSLQPDPGGNPGAGAAPGTLFGGGAPPTGYAPNPYQAAALRSNGGGITPSTGGQVRPTASGPGAQLQPGMPSGANAFRGGTAGPPATANGNQGMPPSGNPQQLQQQMALVQALRNPQGQPPARAMAM